MPIFDYLQTNPTTFLAMVGLFSLCIGSFLNVVIYRLPIMLQHDWRNECHAFLNLPVEKNASAVFNLILPRSHCPQCQKTIHAWHNLPLISYLFLKGKCAYCKSSIPSRYPLIETATALLSIVIAWHFGFSFQTGFALLLTWSLICLTLIDIDHQLLPDSLTLGLLWLGLLANLFGLFTSLESAVIGSMVGYLSLWTCATGFKLLTGKQGMGHGDFKLLAALGAWLGWQLVLFIILVSTLIGSIIGISFILFSGQDKNTPIPFGPFLAAAGWIALLWGHQLINLYFLYANL